MNAKQTLALLEEKIEKIIKHIDDGMDNPQDIKSYLEEALFFAPQEAKDKKGYEMSMDKDGVPVCLVLRQQLVDFFLHNKDKYHALMYVEFQRYWSAPNDRGVPLWYSEKNKPRGRFSLPGRLATWAKRFKPPVEEKKLVNPVDTNIPDRLKMKSM